MRSSRTSQKQATFPKILDELLSEKNFLLDRNIAGTRMIVPKWEHCLEYEYQVRRQAIKLCVWKGFSFQSAWWSVYRDVEHRMEHWMQLLTIANSSSDLAHTPSASAIACDSQSVHALPEEAEAKAHSSLFPTSPFTATTGRRVSEEGKPKQTKAKARKEGRKVRKHPALEHQDQATARNSMRS